MDSLVQSRPAEKKILVYNFCLNIFMKSKPKLLKCFIAIVNFNLIFWILTSFSDILIHPIYLIQCYFMKNSPKPFITKKKTFPFITICHPFSVAIPHLISGPVSCQNIGRYKWQGFARANHTVAASRRHHRSSSCCMLSSSFSGENLYLHHWASWVAAVT